MKNFWGFLKIFKELQGVFRIYKDIFIHENLLKNNNFYLDFIEKITINKVTIKKVQLKGNYTLYNYKNQKW